MDTEILYAEIVNNFIHLFEILVEYKYTYAEFGYLWFLNILWWAATELRIWIH